MSKFDWITPNTSITAIVNHFGSSHGDMIKGLEAREAWRPMETAPKDGTRILVVDEDDEVITVEWRTYRLHYPRCKPTWAWCVPYSDQDEQGGCMDVNPKRWKPLPEL